MAWAAAARACVAGREAGVATTVGPDRPQEEAAPRVNPGAEAAAPGGGHAEVMQAAAGMAAEEASARQSAEMDATLAAFVGEVASLEGEAGQTREEGAIARERLASVQGARDKACREAAEMKQRVAELQQSLAASKQQEATAQVEQEIRRTAEEEARCVSAAELARGRSEVAALRRELAAEKAARREEEKKVSAVAASAAAAEEESRR